MADYAERDGILASLSTDLEALRKCGAQLAQLDWGIVGEVDDDAEGASKAKPKGECDARCTSCGCTYHFTSPQQFSAWLSSTKGAHPQGGAKGATSCPNPNWQVVNG